MATATEAIQSISDGQMNTEIDSVRINNENPATSFTDIEYWNSPLSMSSLVKPLNSDEFTYLLEMVKELNVEEKEKLCKLPRNEVKRMIEGCINSNKRAKHDRLLGIIIKRVKLHLVWWESNKVGQILERKIPSIRAFRDHFWPMKFCGIDKDGNGTVLIKLQDCDWDIAVETVDKDHVLECCMYNNRCLQSVLEILNLPFLTNYIIDFKDMGMKDYYHAYKLGLISIFSMLSGHYPETVKTITILHIPYFFNWCYSAVKQFIEPDTAEKITTFSSSKGIVPFFKSKGFPLESYPQEDGKYILTSDILALHEGDSTNTDTNSVFVKELLARVFKRATDTEQDQAIKSDNVSN